MSAFPLSDQGYWLGIADLQRAREFLTALQAAENAGEHRLVREALSLAGIVSYCRSFMMSYEAEGNKRRWIPEGLLAELPAELADLHRDIVSARDQAWAHTDWESHTPECYSVGVFSPSVVSRDPWVPLDSAQIARFLELIREVDERLQPSSLAQA